MGLSEAQIKNTANHYMNKLVNTLSNAVRKKLDNAAYDVMEEFYNDDPKPRYYKRTRNLKLNSYENAEISRNLSHHSNGWYTKEISLTFSPEYMDQVYYESFWDGHKYQLTENPVPKELIFQWDFIEGYHGKHGAKHQSVPSPSERMKEKTDEIYDWLEKSNSVKKAEDKIFDQFMNKLMSDFMSSSK